MAQNWLTILIVLAVLYYLFLGGDTVEGYYPFWRRRLPWWRRKSQRNWHWGP